MPQAFTTHSVSIRPSSVWTARTSRARTELDPGDPRPGPDARAELPGRSGERMGGGVRVDGAVVGDPDRAVEGLLRSPPA